MDSKSNRVHVQWIPRVAMTGISISASGSVSFRIINIINIVIDYSNNGVCSSHAASTRSMILSLQLVRVRVGLADGQPSIHSLSFLLYYIVSCRLSLV